MIGHLEFKQSCLTLQTYDQTFNILSHLMVVPLSHEPKMSLKGATIVSEFLILGTQLEAYQLNNTMFTYRLPKSLQL